MQVVDKPGTGKTESSKKSEEQKKTPEAPPVDDKKIEAPPADGQNKSESSEGEGGEKTEAQKAWEEKKAKKPKKEEPKGKDEDKSEERKVEKKEEIPGKSTFKKIEKIDWAKKGYAMDGDNSVKELVDQIDFLTDAVNNLGENLDGERGKREEAEGKIIEMHSAQVERLEYQLNERLPQAAKQICETYGIDGVDAEDVGESFVRMVQGGLIEFNPRVHSPRVELLIQGWEKDNPEIVRHGPKKKDEETDKEKKAPALRSSTASTSGASGESKTRDILKKANPHLK